MSAKMLKSQMSEKMSAEMLKLRMGLLVDKTGNPLSFYNAMTSQGMKEAFLHDIISYRNKITQNRIPDTNNFFRGFGNFTPKNTQKVKPNGYTTYFYPEDLGPRKNSFNTKKECDTFSKKIFGPKNFNSVFATGDKELESCLFIHNGEFVVVKTRQVGDKWSITIRFVDCPRSISDLKSQSYILFNYAFDHFWEQLVKKDAPLYHDVDNAFNDWDHNIGPMNSINYSLYFHLTEKPLFGPFLEALYNLHKERIMEKRHSLILKQFDALVRYFGSQEKAAKIADMLLQTVPSSMLESESIIDITKQCQNILEREFQDGLLDDFPLITLDIIQDLFAPSDEVCINSLDPELLPFINDLYEKGDSAIKAAQLKIGSDSSGSVNGGNTKDNVSSVSSGSSNDDSSGSGSSGSSNDDSSDDDNGGNTRGNRSGKKSSRRKRKSKKKLKKAVDGDIDISNIKTEMNPFSKEEIRDKLQGAFPTLNHQAIDLLGDLISNGIEVMEDHYGVISKVNPDMKAGYDLFINLMRRDVTIDENDAFRTWVLTNKTYGKVFILYVLFYIARIAVDDPQTLKQPKFELFLTLLKKFDEREILMFRVAMERMVATRV